MLLATGTLETGDALAPDHLLQLQRTAGNRAVSVAIQRAPGDDDDPYAPIPTGQVAKGAVTVGGDAGTSDPRPSPRWCG